MLTDYIVAGLRDHSLKCDLHILIRGNQDVTFSESRQEVIWNTEEESFGKSSD